MMMRVRTGCTLLYPDGSLRGMGGYVVDTEADGESSLEGQMDLLEECASFFTPDPVDPSRMGAAKKKKATKKKKKKS